MLDPKAKKEEQITEINRIAEAVDALVSMAMGDEAEWELYVAKMKKKASEPKQVAPASPFGQQNITVDPAPSNVVQMPNPADLCQCPTAVKDKHSATHICLLCGKNAYQNKYVFSHMPDGQALLDQTRDVSGVIVASLAQPVFVPITPPALFSESTEDDDGEESY